MVTYRRTGTVVYGFGEIPSKLILKIASGEYQCKQSLQPEKLAPNHIYVQTYVEPPTVWSRYDPDDLRSHILPRSDMQQRLRWHLAACVIETEIRWFGSSEVTRSAERDLYMGTGIVEHISWTLEDAKRFRALAQGGPGG